MSLMKCIHGCYERIAAHAVCRAPVQPYTQCPSYDTTFSLILSCTFVSAVCMYLCASYSTGQHCRSNEQVLHSRSMQPAHVSAFPAILLISWLLLWSPGWQHVHTGVTSMPYIKNLLG